MIKSSRREVNSLARLRKPSRDKEINYPNLKRYTKRIYILGLSSKRLIGSLNSGEREERNKRQRNTTLKKKLSQMKGKKRPYLRTIL
jgi:undecaprenyl pyrophosphate synthase